jgi:c-di-GMP-binding flagellar brake protein YcgR
MESNKQEKKGKAREHKRFRPKSPTFIRVSSKSEEDIGKLIDISKGGLSICYFVSEEKIREYSELSIFSSDTEFALEEIPIKNISDAELKDLLFETTILRRHSIKFDEMTDDQKSKLDYFIKNYTLSED